MAAPNVFRLVHAQARQLAAKFCMEAPDGWMARFGEPKRKDVQSAKFHAMLADISRQSTYAGRKWDEEDTKRILIDEFADEMRQAGTPLHQDSRIIPSEDGRRIIQLNIRSGDFHVKEAANFIEYLYAYGADRDVVWTDPNERGLDYQEPKRLRRAA